MNEKHYNIIYGKKFTIKQFKANPNELNPLN